MDIIYIFRDEKIRDENMIAKQASIFDQVMLTIFVHFVYIVFDLVMGKFGCFAKSFYKSCLEE